MDIYLTWFQISVYRDQFTYDELFFPGRFLDNSFHAKYWGMDYSDHDIFHLVGIPTGLYDPHCHHILVL